jgi:hypothetical protein
MKYTKAHIRASNALAEPFFLKFDPLKQPGVVKIEDVRNYKTLKRSWLKEHSKRRRMKSGVLLGLTVFGTPFTTKKK